MIFHIFPLRDIWTDVGKTKTKHKNLKNDFLFQNKLPKTFIYNNSMCFNHLRVKFVDPAFADIGIVLETRRN